MLYSCGGREMLSIVRCSVRGATAVNSLAATILGANIRTEHIRWAGTYRAAILEDFKKRLIIQPIANRVKLGDDLIRIGVNYCCLNTTDVEYLNGHDDILLPMIPGNEISGEVLEVGTKCRHGFKVGDKVASIQPIRRLGGGLADECIMHEDDCFDIGSVSLKNAAVLAQGHAAALLAFSKICPVDENDNVIVIAGSGGNGLAAIQLANRVYKAKVYAICDTEDTSALIRDEGAYKSIGINQGFTKVYKYLQANFEDNKAKVVYDAVGGGAMYVAADFVDPENGAFLTVDPFYSAETFASLKPEFKKSSSKKETATAEGTPDSFLAKIQHIDLSELRFRDLDQYRQLIQDTLALCEEELVTPYISQTFALDHINRAVRFIKEKKCTGKVLIDLKMEKDGDSDDDDGIESDEEGDEKSKKKPTKKNAD